MNFSNLEFIKKYNGKQLLRFCSYPGGGSTKKEAKTKKIFHLTFQKHH